MKSDPKECLYCQNNDTLHSLMIEVAKLSVSRMFIFKEQTYHGRCLVAYDKHVDDLNLLSDEERNAFMSDMEIETDTEKIVEAEIANNANQIEFSEVVEPQDEQETPDFMKE